MSDEITVDITEEVYEVEITETGPKGDEGEINPDNYDAKASLHDNDKVTGFDSQDSDNPVTWLWSVIKSTFATYYNSLTATLTNKTLTALSNTIYADQVHVNADNETGTTIAKGSPVYASGYNVGQDEVEITLADASDDTKMPAIGITFEEIESGSTGAVAREGIIEGLDTSSYSVGDVLYVSETAGELTSTKPSASGSDVQPIAIVTRSNPGNGVIQVIAVDAYKITPTSGGDIASKDYVDAAEYLEALGLYFDSGNAGIGSIPTKTFEVNKSISGGEVAALIKNSANTLGDLSSLILETGSSGSARMYINRSVRDLVFDVGNRTKALVLTDEGVLTINNDQFSDSGLYIKGSSDANLLYTDASNDRIGIGAQPSTKLDVNGAITQRPLSADPADPDVGNSVQWVSDGTGTGSAGDMLRKINVGGAVTIEKIQMTTP